MGSICKFYLITMLPYCLFCEGGRGFVLGGFCPGAFVKEGFGPGGLMSGRLTDWDPGYRLIQSVVLGVGL